jgi:colanic acid biosynthesis glycosyl transferase WcaI
VEAGVRVTRCPIYVPAQPSGARRVLHHLSFAASIVPPLCGVFLRRRPDLVLVIAPSMISAPVARVFGRLGGSITWLHVQDFEVGAAMATGLITSKGVRAALARRFETFAYAGFDYASSISPNMCARLQTFRFGSQRIFELRNWTDVEEIQPVRPRDSAFWDEWNPKGRQVMLYSGNISRKQGLDGVVGAASLLAHRSDISFLICGDGPAKTALMKKAQGLPNLRFVDLQPRAQLGDLLGLATLHLLPQIAGAADLVLPSKLTNMLASGKPVVATAAAGTALQQEEEGCGLVVRPGDSRALAEAVRDLVDDPSARERMGAAARTRAVERWSKDVILGRLLARIAEVMPDAPTVAADDAVEAGKLAAE